MNIITDKTKAPAKLRYRVSNNSGSINKDKRFYTIEVFEVPSIELIELCDSYNCKLMANILNKKMNIGNLIRW